MSSSRMVPTHDIPMLEHGMSSGDYTVTTRSHRFATARKQECVPVHLLLQRPCKMSKLKEPTMVWCILAPDGRRLRTVCRDDEVFSSDDVEGSSRRRHGGGSDVSFKEIAYHEELDLQGDHPPNRSLDTVDRAKGFNADSD